MADGGAIRIVGGSGVEARIAAVKNVVMKHTPAKHETGSVAPCEG